jgi:hypothetical protein
MLFPVLLFPVIAELAIFCIADYADQYVTDYMVKRYGPQVEENPEVRKMYLTGNFRGNTMMRGSIFVFYAMLGLVVIILPPFAAIAILAGIFLAGIAVANAARGSLIFYRVKRSQTSKVSVS